MQPIIYTLTGTKPGPTTTIFGGVHGDEPVGVMVIEHLSKTLHIESGTVHLVIANPLAVETKQRQLDGYNLNRHFIRKKTLENEWDTLASNLMDLLDRSDALLDIHAFTQPQGDSIPFAFGEPYVYDVTSNFPNIKYVLSGFQKYDKGGSDEYMYDQGKIGLGVELGSKEHPEKFLDLGIAIAKAFLNYYGHIENGPQQLSKEQEHKQEHLTLYLAYKRTQTPFTLATPFKSLDWVQQGDLIANDGDLTIYAGHDGRIVFPRQDVEIGDDTFYLFKRE